MLAIRGQTLSDFTYIIHIRKLAYQRNHLVDFFSPRGFAATEAQSLHPGKAALNGLLAALLAKEGFTGARRILEGEKGFFRATSRDFDEKKCCDGLGEVFHGDRNSLKYHASCGHTHSMLDAILLATGGKTFLPDDVEEVHVSLYQAALDLLGHVEPKTPYLAKFCLPFCVATALRYGQVQLGDFTDARLRDADIRSLMQKVRIQSDPELTGAYPRKWPARVQIVLKRTGGSLPQRMNTPRVIRRTPFPRKRSSENSSLWSRG